MQLALALHPSAATRDAQDVQRFIELLTGLEWITARQIADRYPIWASVTLGHQGPVPFNLEALKRRLRELAELSAGQILSGQAGYKLTSACTHEEAHHAAAWLISQGKLMIRRGIATRRVWHNGGRR